MRYQAGLDGIRAIAIIAVLCFHGGMRWMPGGFLGVDVFFVLSGYLITGLLLKERTSTGRLDLRAFYIRRARRLLPALIAMLVISLVCASLFMKDVVASALRDLPWAAAGLSNWWFIFHHQSYFEAMGRPPLFQHTWSLAVEAQFYLIWPMAISLLFPLYGRAGIRRIALTCATLSAGALFLVSLGIDRVTGAGASHAYFGTDTHSVGIFLGAALAAIKWPARSLRKSWWIDGVGIAAFTALLLLFHEVGESTVTLYRVGFPLASIASLILIAAALVPGGAAGRWLGVGPLTWIGKRSYSIYVWHWPIFQATRPGTDFAVEGNLVFLLRLALTALVAELSYRFIEMPFRSGAFNRIWSTTRTWNRGLFRFAAAATVMLALVITVAEARLIRNAMAVNAKPAKIPVPARADKTPAIAPPVSVLPKTKPAFAEALKLPTVLLGDSVLLGAGPSIAEQVNIVKTDAIVGRQAAEVRRLAQSMAEEGTVEPNMIVNLGNNGTVDEVTLRAIMDAFKPCRRIVVVNARVPRRWQDDNDDLMAKIVPLYPNAVLADWRAASEGHREYFGPDGVHANTVGAKVYADVVVSALQSAWPPSPSTP